MKRNPMTKYDDALFAKKQKNVPHGRKWFRSEEEEHSSCGVGLVVNIDGSCSRDVVLSGIKALAIWHRGAVDDGKIGDGAGIHANSGQSFL
jgi:glutamate synthase (NADPH/NADH) large chain